MGVLQRFERRIEGLVNGAFAKAFKSDVQPVEIASALQRECDDKAAIVSRGRTMVPNDFVVELGKHDHERLSVYAEPLAAEFVDLVRDYAQQQRYSFVGPVEVRFDLADDLDTGMFRVRGQALAGVIPMGGREGAHATAWLEVRGERHPLGQQVTTLGRGTDVDLRIDDPGVSRQHAEIRAGLTTVIVDLGSTNGTRVDGQRVQQAPLEDGSTIVLGNTTLVFRRD
ncbi:MAG: FhaA domain-containing protein [Carbonactinosporaceae bacterium]